MKKPKYLQTQRNTNQLKARKLNFAKYRVMGAHRSLETLSNAVFLPIELKESLTYAVEHLTDALFQWPKHIKGRKEE